MMSKNMSRRRVLKLMGLSVAGVTALAACAPPEEVVEEPEIEEPVEETEVEEPEVEETEVEEPEVEETEPADKKPVTIAMNARSGDIEQFERQLELTGWYENNPDITVESMGVPAEEEYWDKIITMAAGGQLEGLFWSSIGTGGFQRLAVRGLCLDLDPLDEADGEFDINDFIEGAVDPLRMEGSLYALPRRIHPGRAAVWYNIDAFEEAGVDPPTEDWTFEDLVNTADKLTKRNGNGRVDQWGYQQGGTDMLHQTVLIRGFDGWEISEDGKESLLNSPEAKEALTWVYDLMYSHEVYPPAGAIEGDTAAMFTSGRTVMSQLGWWGRFQAEDVKELPEEDQFDVGSVPLPHPFGPWGSMFEVNCVNIASKTPSEKVDATWELMKGLTSLEVNLDIIENLFGAARKEALDVYLEQGLPIEDYMMPVYDILDNCMEFRMCWNWRAQEYTNEFNSQLDPLWLGNAEPTDEFFDSVKDALQEVLERPMVGA